MISLGRRSAGFDIGFVLGTSRSPDYLKKVPASMHHNGLFMPLSIKLHNTATMICRQCLRRASALRPQSRIVRFISTTPAPGTPPAATAADAAAPQFSNPLAGTSTPSKPRPAGLPVSAAPVGTNLRGINYLKNTEDPVALEEHEYPEWLWRCLDANKDDNAGAAAAGDEFCMHPLSTKFAQV